MYLNLVPLFTAEGLVLFVRARFMCKAGKFPFLTLSPTPPLPMALPSLTFIQYPRDPKKSHHNQDCRPEPQYVRQGGSFSFHGIPPLEPPMPKFLQVYDPQWHLPPTPPLPPPHLPSAFGRRLRGGFFAFTYLISGLRSGPPPPICSARQKLQQPAPPWLPLFPFVFIESPTLLPHESQGETNPSISYSSRFLSLFLASCCISWGDFLFDPGFNYRTVQWS